MEVNLGYLLRRNAFKFPDKEAIVFEDRRITYRQFNARTNQRANALLEMGIKKGDHVATMFLNCNEVLETFYALFKIGAVPVPLNIRLSSKELIYIIDHSDSTSIILSGDFKNLVESIRPECKKIRNILCTGTDIPESMIPFDELTDKSSIDEPDEKVNEEDVACLLYTAGTTGRPKGVIITHRNSVWAAVNAVLDTDNRPEYKVLLVFPLYHAAAYTLVNTNIFIGCTTVLLKSFDPRLVMETVERERINRMTFPPTVWNFILQIPDLEKYKRDSVRSISSGAEAMPMETKKRLIEVFPNAKIGESYGMTESTATITTCKPEDVERKFSSVGKPFTNVEIRLVDENGNDVPKGEVGEILFRGPTMMKGYYKDPEATSEAIRGGWLHTGDLGRLDDEGFLYIVDRKKDMIISGGENIYPREIEEVLYQHPKVLEAAVIGLPDPIWGEKVHAIVVPKEGELLTEEEIINFCKDRIASFKKPKSVSFVERLPRNPAGKVLKTVLRKQYCQI
jgi:acyl-CoA synthetase (AMP-forming)/AMP-acid ligase II